MAYYKCCGFFARLHVQVVALTYTTTSKGVSSPWSFNLALNTYPKESNTYKINIMTYFFNVTEHTSNHLSFLYFIPTCQYFHQPKEMNFTKKTIHLGNVPLCRGCCWKFIKYIFDWIWELFLNSLVSLPIIMLWSSIMKPFQALT